MLLADPAEIQRFSRAIESFVADLRGGIGGLMGALEALSAVWADENYASYCADFSESARHLDLAAELFLEQRLRLAQLTRQLEGVVLAGGSPGRSTSAAPRRTPQPGSGCAALGLRGGRLLLAPEALRDLDDAGRIDWGEPDFADEFQHGTHHGHRAADYLALADQLPAALSGAKGTAAEVWLTGRDPIHLTLRPNGTLEVSDGRHRLMAAMQRGLPAPVELMLPARSASGTLSWHSAGGALPLRDIRRAMVSNAEETTAIASIRAGNIPAALETLARAQLPLRLAAVGLADRVQAVLPDAALTVSVKEPDSLAEKLTRTHRDGTPHHTDLSEISDRLRLEAVLPLAAHPAAITALKARFDVREVQASGNRSRPGMLSIRRPSGYSAVHVRIEEGGEPVEIQLHTPAEHAAWQWSHAVYKDPVWSRDRRMQAFSRAWWGHLTAVEDGRPSSPPPWPEGLPERYRPPGHREATDAH